MVKCTTLEHDTSPKYEGMGGGDLLVYGMTCRHTVATENALENDLKKRAGTLYFIPCIYDYDSLGQDSGRAYRTLTQLFIYCSWRPA